MLSKKLIPALLALGFSISGAEPLAVDRVLVRLGDFELRVADVDGSLYSVPQRHRAGLMRDPQRVGTRLDTLILRRAIVNSARQDGKLDGFDWAEARSRIETDILYHKQLESELAAIPLPDLSATARNFYSENQEQFRVPESVDVSHVLVKTEERSPLEAKRIAEQVRAEAERDGSLFEELVFKYSEDASRAQNRGRFPEVVRGQMVPPFEAAAFALQASGQLAGPVKTQFGYHIIRLNGRKPARVRSYDEVQSQVLQLLEQERQASQRQTLLDQFDDPRESLAARAKDNGVHQDAQFIKAVDLALEEEALRYYREQYSAPLASIDFSSLAKEQYLSKPNLYTTSAAVIVELAEMSAFSETVTSQQAVEEAKRQAALWRDGAAMSSDLLSIKSGRRVLELKQLSSTLAQALAPLQPGEITDPIDFEDTFLVARLIERIPAKLTPFEEVADSLVARNRAEAEVRNWDLHVGEFRRLALWVDEEAIPALRDRYLLN